MYQCLLDYFSDNYKCLENTDDEKFLRHGRVRYLCYITILFLYDPLICLNGIPSQCHFLTTKNLYLRAVQIQVIF